MKFFLVVAFAACAMAQLTAEREFIDQINSMQSSWLAGESHITRMPLKTAKGLLGVDMDNLKALPLVRFTPQQIGDVPDTFDSRDNWPKCETIGTILDQRHCGSCWAFGAIEAMSDRYCIFNGKNLLLSAEDMNSCSGWCGDCDGGYPSCAWSYWKSTGLVSDDCYPYTAGRNKSEIVTPDCLSKCTGNPTKTWKTDKHFAKSSYSASGEKNIMTEIFNNGPVECAFTVYRDFMTYKTGIYYHTTGEKLGGHAVKMLGWGVDGSMKYWLCANSWNTTWGDQGFFKIRKGTNECGIESTVWAGLPASD